MIAPRSFMYSSRPRPPSPSPPSSPSGISKSPSTSSLSPTSYTKPLVSVSRTASTTSPSNSTTLRPTRLSPLSNVTTDTSSLAKETNPLPTRTKRPQQRFPDHWSAKYEGSRLNTNPSSEARLLSRSSSTASVTDAQSFATMGKRKERREPLLAPPSPPDSPMMSEGMRPTTPTSPVQIPKQANRRSAHHHQPQRRHTTHRRPGRDAHTSDSISPSVAALLAVTDIPRPRQRRCRSDKALTVDEAINNRQQASEKDLSWTLSRGTIDMLLSPPEDMGEDDDMSFTDSNIGSAFSTRTVSVDSIPSLVDSFATELASSLDTPSSASLNSRRRGPSPMRRSLEPVRSPPGADDEHPLASRRSDLDELVFTSLPSPASEISKPLTMEPFKPLKSMFKSNLTASLRALRSAAKSFSGLNVPVVPNDEILTQSVLTIDPKVPYADEVRPPVSEEIPSAELRRYLNPTTSSRIETNATNAPSTTFSASIQMRTYKVHRSRSLPPASRNSLYTPPPSRSHSTGPHPPQPQSPNRTAFTYPPGMRQREMRENSDFIRIAVMEMAMRKQGKLDDHKPGRARWVLPPRKSAVKPYQVGVNGVPTRWIAISG